MYKKFEKNEYLGFFISTESKNQKYPKKAERQKKSKMFGLP